jgi:hypothetical protein
MSAKIVFTGFFALFLVGFIYNIRNWNFKGTVVEADKEDANRMSYF